MTYKKPLLEHQKQCFELAIDEISTPIFSTKTSSGKTGEVFIFVSRSLSHINTQSSSLNSRSYK